MIGHLLIAFFLISSISSSTILEATAKIKHVNYAFTNEPIDVVIPSIEKDLETLNLCIAGIKANCKNVRRVIVVSAKRLTKNAEWFNELNYPFTKQQVAFYLCQKNKMKAYKFLSEKPNWLGWYFQQLLKLYAPLVIPGISSNVLILDSDTIFLNPVEFLNKQKAGMYYPWDYTHLFDSYFVHARKLVPDFSRPFPQYSGISHHMLFQKCVILDLFKTVSDYHGVPFWKAFCLCADSNNLCMPGAAEYEIYFNFLFSRSSLPTIRFLKNRDNCTNGALVIELKKYKAQGYHLASIHRPEREK